MNFNLKYITFIAPFVMWWIPLLGPFLTGLLFSYYFKTNYKYSIIISAVYSIMLSLLTSFILINLIKISFINNLFHGVVILFNILGSLICVITSYLSSKHGSFTKIKGDSIETEFIISNMNQLDEMLSHYVDIRTCNKPNIKFIDESHLEVTRECSNIKITYDIIKMGKELRVKAKFKNML